MEAGLEGRQKGAWRVLAVWRGSALGRVLGSAAGVLGRPAGVREGLRGLEKGSL